MIEKKNKANIKDHKCTLLYLKSKTYDECFVFK